MMNLRTSIGPCDRFSRSVAAVRGSTRLKTD
jgi:hypothetical protein